MRSITSWAASYDLLVPQSVMFITRHGKVETRAFFPAQGDMDLHSNCMKKLCAGIPKPRVYIVLPSNWGGAERKSYCFGQKSRWGAFEAVLN